MKRSFTYVMAIAAAAILTSCSITTPLAVSSAPIGNKVGTSSTTVIFGNPVDPMIGIHTNKNFGIQEAAKNAGIKGGVATVDVKVTRFVFFHKVELIVTGE